MNLAREKVTGYMNVIPFLNLMKPAQYVSKLADIFSVYNEWQHNFWWRALIQKNEINQDR